jgi:dUTP pyrophosphatase
MTENKPDLEVLPGGKDDPVIEVELEDDKKEEPTFSDEQIEQFYEENKDSIDMIGGLEMLEALLETPDEQFVMIAPKFLEVLQSTLQDPQTRTEFRAYLQDKNYTSQDISDEARAFNEAIEQMDFLSEPKKDVIKQAIAVSVNLLQEINNSMERIIEIPCETAEGVELPTYANEGDAGLDIYSPKEYTINPGETIIIPTGIKVAIPKGYAILIQPRSGQSVKTKLRIANTPGLIDSGYRDEIGVIVENIEPPFKDLEYHFDDNGKPIIDSILHGQAYTIAEGQRFAQMRLVQVPTASFVQVDSVANLGEDRGGGFGHTGE